MRSSSSYVSRNRSFDARKRRLSSALTIYDLRDIARRRTVPRPWWWYDFLTIPKFTSASLTTTGGTVGELLEVAMDLTISFADLKVIRELWPGKIAVKGAQSVADAKELSGLGVDGIVLSNHGGRQLDRAPVRFPLLPAVVREVWRDTEITVDTGIMNGADIVAAIALGAKFTLIGPACLWGLMAGSRAGVDRAIDPHRPDRAHHEAARRARPRRAHPRLRDTTPRPPPHRGGQSG